MKTGVVLFGLTTLMTAPSDGAPMQSPFREVATAAIGEFDLEAWRLARSKPGATCQLPSGAEAWLVPRGEGAQDWRLRLSTRGEVAVEPSAGIAAEGWGAPALLACDAELERVFVAHPLLGYVIAYSATGKELWRSTIEGFRPGFHSSGVISAEQARGASATAHVGGRLAAKGRFVLLEHRHGEEGTIHDVWHRSGRYVGRIGPWAAFLHEVDKRGFEFYVSEAGTGWMNPKRAVIVQVAEDPFEEVFQHFVAWLLPPPEEKKYAFRACSSLPIETIRPLMGERFQQNAARLSRQALLHLKGTWFRTLATESGLMPLLADYRASDQLWLDRFNRALLERDVDVVLASVLDELDEKPQSTER